MNTQQNYNVAPQDHKRPKTMRGATLPKSQFNTLINEIIYDLFPWKAFGNHSQYPGIMKGLNLILGDFTWSALQNWRSGRRHPTPETWDRLADHLGAQATRKAALASRAREQASERRAYLASLRKLGRAPASERAEARAEGERVREKEI